MGPKTPVLEGDLFRQPLREQINLKHPLVRLADLIEVAECLTSTKKAADDN
ncbi:MULTISPECIES: hypothetical protein [Burkholderiaceae]|uniref:hypothetical protein n=1 Tax=Burkholderiaceae TaxID=119060 RepID=UPI0009639ACD|nr:MULTISPECIES: hypothetical protein [Burkholderiaceae]MCF2135407.1 hypothetical protein [Mycetohabitans sp. B3]MCG1040778.1 hypothetical protein [Mycetohabitans sp. B7]SIT65116.1 transposase, IS5 family [Burkholderia sp. b14]